MAKAGRPSKLTAEVIERIELALKGGNFRFVAAKWAGVSPETFRAWMRQGREQKKGPFRDFYRRVLEAEQQAEIQMVARVMKAAAEDAKHAEWWLERKHAARWGRKQEIKHAGHVELDTLTDEQLEARLNALVAQTTPTADEPGGDE